MSSMALDRKKALGAFYTDQDVIRFLVGWALKEPESRVMDPSCGDGRFLIEAKTLGASELVGCDIDPDAICTTSEQLADVEVELIQSDFFALEPDSIAPMDLVIGNPPFIRYQQFKGASRKRALASARRVGVKLSGLTASWAPFLLHAIQFLKPGGDLAMVVPAKLIQTQYGIPTLRAIADRFADVRLLAFERNLFRNAQEETFLLLATAYGKSSEGVWLHCLRDRRGLETWAETFSGEDGAFFPLTKENNVRLVEGFLTSDEREAWNLARTHTDVRQLSELGSLTNGYVSGDNKFFHRTRSEAQKKGYPEEWLWPAVRQSRSLRGLLFTAGDIRELESKKGIGHHLVVPEEGLFGGDQEALDRFRKEGKERGTSERYKCRTRKPWWRVPGLQSADVFFTYMNGARPRAAVNATEAVYTNTLHGLRVNAGISARQVALCFHSSLALLSQEIEGRSYGGGMLKLEPTELQQVCIPWPSMDKEKLLRLSVGVDLLLRSREYKAAVRYVDQAILVDALGMPEKLVQLLWQGRQRLVARRKKRTRKISE